MERSVNLESVVRVRNQQLLREPNFVMPLLCLSIRRQSSASWTPLYSSQGGVIKKTRGDGSEA